jgi:hypothetical protein
MNNNPINMAVVQQQGSLFPPAPLPLPAVGNINVNTPGIHIGQAIGAGANGIGQAAGAIYTPLPQPGGYNINTPGGISLQSGFSFFKWNTSYDYPKHLFEDEKPLFAALALDSATALMFHVSVWIECCQPSSDDYGIVWDGQVSRYTAIAPNVPDVNAMHGCLLIKQGKTLDEFKTWFAQYKSRFAGDSWKTEQLPFVKEAQELNGTPIKHGETLQRGLHNTILATDKIFDRWCWIVQNTTQPVWIMGEFWFFNNQSEMIMYKLIDEK